jgi:MFS family permease
MEASPRAVSSATFLDMTRYQWTVLFAAWLGWGFDIFDGLLFNFVAPNCVPTLLGLPIGSPEARSQTMLWTGMLTSLLLVGWAVGGVLFGAVTDRIGRTRTLLLTMAIYSVGTAACAFAPNIWVLAACRLVASLGIGGEWAAGAAMVAEVVPENRRVEAGALLYTSAPLGLFLATFVDWYIAGNVLLDDPARSWRYVFLCGLIPAAVAFIVRLFIEEPERWHNATKDTKPPAFRELFEGDMRRVTLGGLSVAIVALVTWWSCNAFISIVATGLGGTEADALGLEPSDVPALVTSFKTHATSYFNLGGLIGTMLTVPIAKTLGRRAMFGLYYGAAAISILCAFGLDLSPSVRVMMYFPIGLTVFGVFGAFTYYLPELYPTRLRGTGSGFCYNAGRVLAAFGPFVVAGIASRGSDAFASALDVLFYVGFVPLLGLVALVIVPETKGRVLAD